MVIENGLYKINGIFTDRANEGAHQFVVNYKGKLEFIVGEDDPEPSGYKVTMSKQQATIQDPVTYQPIPLPGLSKYTFKITDPDGNDAGAIDAINATDVDITALAGTYKIQGNPDKAWTTAGQCPTGAWPEAHTSWLPTARSSTSPAASWP